MVLTCQRASGCFICGRSLRVAACLAPFDCQKLARGIRLMGRSRTCVEVMRLWSPRACPCSTRLLINQPVVVQVHLWVPLVVINTDWRYVCGWLDEGRPSIVARCFLGYDIVCSARTKVPASRTQPRRDRGY